MGTVVVEVEITADGKVNEARVISGHPLLGIASRKASLTWRFELASELLRKTKLTFDFFIPELLNSKTESTALDPYHFRISAGCESQPVSDTVSYVPATSEHTRCKRHGEELQKDKVEIIYGLVGFRKGYLEAEEKFFPNANSKVFGGCVITEEVSCDGTRVQASPKYAEVLYCSKCRKARSEWSRKHSNAPFRS